MELQAELTTKNLRKARFNPEILLASNKDGEKIGSLVNANGFTYKVDWSDIYPYWLIAKVDDQIVGCIQVLPGKPIGRIEMAATNPDLTALQRANIYWRLVVTSIAMLQAGGSQLASSMILFDNKNVKKLLKKRGAIAAGQGNIMIMRIGK